MFNQYYETTIIVSPELNPLKFISLPKINMVDKYQKLFEPGAEQLWKSHEIYKVFGVEITEGIHFSNDKEHSILNYNRLWPYLVYSTLSFDRGEEAMKFVSKAKHDNSFTLSTDLQPYLEAAMELTVSNVIPVSNSPFGKKSIVDIISQGSGVGIGATVGVLVAWGSPLIFIAVPLGMIIGGACAGIGKGLEKGIEQKLIEMIGGKERNIK